MVRRLSERDKRATCNVRSYSLELRIVSTNDFISRSSFDGTARLWDSVTGECLHVFREHRRPLYALKFSPDGKLIATGSGDGWMHIYRTRVRFTLAFHH
jgi:WD40 repeat protein